MEEIRKSDSVSMFGFTRAERSLFKKSGETTIAQYLKDMTKGTAPSNRIKLLTVGNARHGKTSLLYYLKRGKPLQVSESTDGIDIDIDTWKVEDPTGNEILVSRWDFAGQKVTI